jgi:hypothetical protein
MAEPATIASRPECGSGSGVVMVLVPFAPWTTETDVGEAAMLNAGVAPEVTVRETVAV